MNQKIDKAIFSGGSYKQYRNYWNKYISNKSGFQWVQKQQRGISPLTTSFKFELDKVAQENIVGAFGKSDVGTFVCLTAVFGILFNKYSGNQRVIIKTPFFHSNDEKNERFAIDVPLVLDIKSDDTLKHYLNDVKNNIRDDYKYQNFPIEEMLDIELHSNIMLRYEGLHEKINHKASGENDLLIEVKKSNDEFTIELHYDSTSFETSFIHNIQTHLNKTIAELKHLEKTIKKIDIISAEETNQLLNEFNNVYKPLGQGKTIVEVFEEQMKQNPKQLAVVCGEARLSYKKLNERANQIAHYLRNELKVQPNDIVGVLVERGHEAIVAILGVLKSGATYLPIDPNLPLDRIKYLIDNASIKALVTETEMMFKINDFYKGSLFVIDIQLTEEASNIENLPINNTPEDTAYVIYTSGSTGYPKGVMIKHESNINMVFDQIARFSICSEDRILQFASLSFDASIYEMFIGLYAGATVVIANNEIIKNGLGFINYLRDNEVSMATLPPAYLSILDVDSLSFLRVLVTAGEEVNLADAFKATKFLDYYNAYGPTECAVCSSIYKVEVEDENKTSIPIGKPISGLKSYVLDESLNLQPIGIEGEICFSGVGVSKGYLNAQTLTDEKFVEHPFAEGEILYRTGDLGKWLPDGNIEFTGRKDDQIKLNGYRVEKGEIAYYLMQHESVDNVCIAKKANDVSSYLVAYVISNSAITSDDLKAYLEGVIPDYMVPAHIVFLDHFPLTNSGKIDYKVLEEVNGEVAIQELAENDTQEKLIEIWKAMFKTENIGINSSYYSQGGDSLQAIQMVIGIEKIFEKSIPVAAIYTHKTIKELSKLIDEQPSNSSTTDLEIGLQLIEEFKASIIENEPEKIPTGYEDLYPLTSIELGMIYSSLLRPEEPIFYDQFTFQLKINNIDQFYEAMLEMTQRHSIFRSIYYLSGFKESIKVVMKEIELPLDYQDLSSLVPEGQKEAIDTCVSEDRKIRLNFNGDLPWRLKVLYLGDKNYFILWNVHHSLMDGWSENCFKTEITKILSEDETYNFQPLKHNYKDYCAITLAKKQGGVVNDFWKEYLSGYSRNKLPFNYSGKKNSEVIDVIGFEKTLDYQIVARIGTLALENEFSLKAIYLAANIYCLHKLCGDNDLVIGVVTHDRPAIEDGDKIIGCFLNVIPIRVNMEKISTYFDLIEKVDSDLEHIGINQLHLTDIAKLVGEDTNSGNLLFDCILNYTDFRAVQGAVDSPNLSLNYETNEKVTHGYGMTNTLFDFEIGTNGKQVITALKYMPSYFDSSEIDYALSLYHRILEAIALDVHQPMDFNILMNEEERNWFISDFNNTATPYSKEATLHSIFEQQVITSSDAVALKCGSAEMTYGDLNARSNQLARYLISNGVKPNDNIGLIANRNFEMIVGMYGILKTGGAYVPIDPDYPIDRQQYIIENSQASHVLTDMENSMIRSCTGDESLMIADSQSEQDTTNLKIDKSSNDLAYTIYTSGSTGLPKGVMIAHESAVNLVEWVNMTYNIGVEDNLLFITSMCFDLSVYDIFGMLSTGGTVVIADQESLHDIKSLKVLLQENHITFWDSVPTTMNYLINELESDGSDYLQHELRLVFMSGDWIPVSLPDRLKQYFPSAQVVSLGGATEGTVWSNYYEIDEVDEYWGSIPYGRPISNNTFYILDDHQQLVPRGVAGELYIGGIGVAKGYANDQAKTKASFMKDPYRSDLGGMMYKTGDLGRILPGGDMEFLGRKDHQVKIRGYRVELGEIEHQLEKCTGIISAIVGVHKDSIAQNYLCGYLVCEGTIDLEKIRGTIIKKLPSYMLPTTYMILEEFPMTSNGKIDRKRLPEPSIKGTKSQVEASSQLERRLLALWEQVLGRDKIGVTDDFLELGAHSLNIGSFVNKVHRELDVVITMPEVFMYSTVKELATLILTKHKESFISIEPIEVQEHYAVSHAQKRLWIADRLDTEKAVYNIPGFYVFEGVINREALRKSFNLLIDRHEVLRTTFIYIDGEPRQKIHPLSLSSFRLDYIDIQKEKQIDLRIQNEIRKESSKKFDLEEGPLLRAVLLQISPTENVLLFTMHHIISDRQSIGILTKEMITCYNAVCAGREVKLSPLRIQYKDYAYWHNMQLTPKKIIKNENYWLNKLHKATRLELPTDYNRPDSKTYNGNWLHVEFDRHIVETLNELGKRQQSTIFMLLVTSINVLLYRISGKNDIIVGTTVAGRDHLEIEDQIGFYVNTLALRIAFNDNDSFLQLLNQVKQCVLSAFEHWLYPFDMLVEKLDLERDASHTPVFDVLVEFTKQDDGSDNDELTGLSTSNGGVKAPLTQYDLSFRFMEQGKSLSLLLEYNTDLYGEETIEVFKNGLSSIFKHLIDMPEMQLKDVELGEGGLSEAFMKEEKLKEDYNLFE